MTISVIPCQSNTDPLALLLSLPIKHLHNWPEMSHISSFKAPMYDKTPQISRLSFVFRKDVYTELQEYRAGSIACSPWESSKSRIPIPTKPTTPVKPRLETTSHQSKTDSSFPSRNINMVGKMKFTKHHNPSVIFLVEPASRVPRQSLSTLFCRIWCSVLT